MKTDREQKTLCGGGAPMERTLEVELNLATDVIVLLSAILAELNRARLHGDRVVVEIWRNRHRDCPRKDWQTSEALVVEA